MKSKPNATVIVLSVLLLLVLLAMIWPVYSLIQTVLQLQNGPFLSADSQPAVPSAEYVGPTDPAVTQPTELPTDPTALPTAPATQPTAPATEPSLGQPCDHSYDAQSIAATCTAQGYTLYTCQLCGDSYTGDYTDLGAHTLAAWQPAKEATCTAAGEERATCTVCGAVQNRTVEAKGHSYGAWVTTRQPSCTQQGSKSRSCSRCGDAQDQAIASKGHSYDAGVVVKVANSCADKGVKRYTCNSCGHKSDAAIWGDHTLYCDTCKQYGTDHKTLHDPTVSPDFAHDVRCVDCEYFYYDVAYEYLNKGLITADSAMFTDTVKLKNPEYTGVLGTWSDRWHEFAAFVQCGILYGSWSTKDGWEGSDYELRIRNINSAAEADAVLADYHAFAVEFAKLYCWKPVDVSMEYDTQHKSVRLFYYDQDQYNTYRTQKKNVTPAQKQALADEVIGYTLHKYGIRDGMKVANILEYLYQIIWTDVAYYDHSLRWHSAFDGFATRSCVCDGYSEMFLMYADALGFQAKEITGTMSGTGHAWNRVIFSDGSKWHVDITNGPILRTDESMRENGYKFK